MLMKAFLFALIGGSGIFAGAVLARYEHLRSRWLENELHHTVIAFGGGALIAGVALVLIPEGIQNQSPLSITLSFLGGGFVFMLLGKYLAGRKTAASQLMAMLLDFVPEAMIIGAIITQNYHQALLLTIIIFVQNVPESFNAYCEMKQSTRLAPSKLLGWFLLIACTGPLYVLAGQAVFFEHEKWLGALMTFCAGGIFYIIFNDIAPQAKLQRQGMPAMGALLGFMVGLIGKILIK